MFSMFISASLYTLSDSEVKDETAQAVGGRNLYGVITCRLVGPNADFTRWIGGLTICD